MKLKTLAMMLISIPLIGCASVDQFFDPERVNDIEIKKLCAKHIKSDQKYLNSIPVYQDYKTESGFKYTGFRTDGDFHCGFMEWADGSTRWFWDGEQQFYKPGGSSSHPGYIGGGHDGPCAVPSDRASDGSRCGGRSAWSRPGGN